MENPASPPPALPAELADVLREARPGDGRRICELFELIEWDEDPATQARRQAERAMLIDGGTPAGVVKGREHYLPRYHVVDGEDRGVLAAAETAPPVEWIRQRPTLSPQGREALAAAVVEVHAIAVAPEHRGNRMGHVLLYQALRAAAERGARLAMAIMHAEQAGFYTFAGWKVVDNQTMVGVTVGSGPAGIAWRPLDPDDPRLRLAFKPLHPQVAVGRAPASAELAQQVYLLDGVVPKRNSYVDADQVRRLSAPAPEAQTTAGSAIGENRAARRAAARSRRDH